MLAHFNEYQVDQQIEYRYLLGRYYLLNSQVHNAFVQFNEAFQSLLNLPPVSYTHLDVYKRQVRAYSLAESS